jgi:hypothetical protein
MLLRYLRRDKLDKKVVYENCNSVYFINIIVDDVNTM